MRSFCSVTVRWVVFDQIRLMTPSHLEKRVKRSPPSPRVIQMFFLFSPLNHTRHVFFCFFFFIISWRGKLLWPVPSPSTGVIFKCLIMTQRQHFKVVARQWWCSRPFISSWKKKKKHDYTRAGNVVFSLWNESLKTCGRFTGSHVVHFSWGREKIFLFYLFIFRGWREKERERGCDRHKEY